MAVAGVHLQNKPILFSYKSLPRFSCRWLVLPDFSSLKSCCLWPGMETVLPFSHVLKKGSSLAIFTPFISNPHSVPKVLQEELRQAAAQNSPEFRDQEPSCGRLSQVIPVCRLCSVAGVHSRCEKQKTQCNLLLESLRFSTLCIPPTPLSGVQPCLLHGHFGSPQGGPAGEKKFCSPPRAANTTSCEGMHTPTRATEAVRWPLTNEVAGIPTERTLWQKDVASSTPGQGFRNLWLDAASVRIRGAEP